MMKDKILILYTEYAPYLDACLRKLTALYPYDVHVVRYPVDKNAPFSLSQDPNIVFHNRHQFTRKQLLGLFEQLSPKALIVSGWIDMDYNSIAWHAKNKGLPVIAVVDNQWTGSMKQRAFTLFGAKFLQSRFTHFWIPGTTQYEYMRKLGVDGDKIMTGYYSADTDLFGPKYKPSPHFRKRFVYVGRLLDIKGTKTLIDCLRHLGSSGDLKWPFLIIGNGKYEEEVKKLAKEYENIEYKPFMQPQMLAEETAEGGVFVLPSNYDAWGVVVHEFATLGYPLVLSSMVGSRHYFVTPGYNGFYFKAQNASSLAITLKWVMALPDEELLQMSMRSHLIGKTITTEAWAKRLATAIESHYLPQ